MYSLTEPLVRSENKSKNYIELNTLFQNINNFIEKCLSLNLQIK